MSPQLTLYTFKLSLWAASGRLAVYELDIPNVKFVEVDLSKAENFSPDFLGINPNHTIPTLEVIEDRKKEIMKDTTSVVNYLNTLAGNQLSVPDHKDAMDDFIKEMHDSADVGNPLFFTSGSPEELEAKKSIIIPFLQGRIDAWKNYIKESPSHAVLYTKNIVESQVMLKVYETGTAAGPMYSMNKNLWETAQKFLNKAERLLKAHGSFLFGQYSVAEIHFTPYLHRLLLVRQPEQVFEKRPLLEAYYKSLQARPSFEKTFQ